MNILSPVAASAAPLPLIQSSGIFAAAYLLLPHLECGGEAGGTVLLSMTAPDGILFEYFDETMRERWTLSVAAYVEAWASGVPYGTAPQAA